VLAEMEMDAEMGWAGRAVDLGSRDIGYEDEGDYRAFGLFLSEIILNCEIIPDVLFCWTVSGQCLNGEDFLASVLTATNTKVVDL